jgi:hypothetical protein
MSFFITSYINKNSSNKNLIVFCKYCHNMKNYLYSIQNQDIYNAIFWGSSKHLSIRKSLNNSSRKWISKLENSPNEIIEEFKFKLENTFTYKQLNLLKKILLNKNLNLENKNG